jgi:hypothetical protein
MNYGLLQVSLPYPMGGLWWFITYLLDLGWGPVPPAGTSQGPALDVSYRGWWALPDLQLSHFPGARRRRFLALMANALGSPAPTPLGGPPSMFLSVDGGRSRISSFGISWGPAVDVFSIDGGRSRISSSGPSRGPVVDVFLVLMVGAPGSPAPTPSRGPPSMFHSVDGGRSRIFSSDTSRGPPLNAK